jgi:hypothetical protein
MRTRHEYRVSLGERPRTLSDKLPPGFKVRNPDESDVRELAELMLDSYRETIDYDGETIKEATIEVKSYFERIDSRAMLSCSFVAVSENHIFSACLASRWEKRSEPLISYLMTKGKFKGQGLAKALLRRSLQAIRRSLQAIRDSGHDGAIGFVTEGNTPSERLLVGSGFSRIQ